MAALASAPGFVTRREPVLLRRGRSVVFRQNVALLGHKILGLDESDLAPSRMRSQNPRDVFHLTDGRVLPADVFGADSDGEGDPVTTIRSMTASGNGECGDPL